MASIEDSLEENANKIIKRVDNQDWGKSIPEMLKREIALTVSQINRLRELKDKSLRTINPVPLIMNQLNECIGAFNESQRVFTVLTELYQNALDHGVLNLSSEMKNSAEGFARFFLEKEERLQNITDSSVEICVTFKVKDGQVKLLINITDSGEGFDFLSWLQGPQGDPLYSGRGIKLLSGLCEGLEYHGNGNRVSAEIRW